MRYAKFSDVPYDVWAKGGDIEITDINSIPAELRNGQVIGIVPNSGNIAMSSGGAQDNPVMWWGWYIIGAIIVGVLFAAVYRLTIYDTFVVLRSAPEGKLEELDNGDRIYTAPDGTTYLWDHVTGAWTQIGGPTNIDITTIIKYVSVLAILLIVGYMIIKGSDGLKSDYAKVKAAIPGGG